MLTVITPGTSTALTTLARAKALLGFGSADDAAATVLIGQASRVIAEHCRRPFGVASYRETFSDRDCGEDGPLLSRGPVVEVIAVRSIGVTFDPSEYRVSEAGRLQRIEPDGRVVPWWGSFLTVDYRAGYVLPQDGANAPAQTLPDSVERAAIMIVATYLSLRGRDPTVKSESNDGLGQTSWWVPGAGDSLPSPEAEQLLVPFVRYWP
ncbi:hypothetical protein [Methylobacterium oryzae]|uniref:hypothetical protein n=1 Tax=Methylobacterium oryzae TaxID=334852 RepID=UPI001F29F380|nr:hypothetical protein [Methylobacterium oryzae]UIN36285.1 hypothetical protein LXM90_07235 [Methylobacterium oryzae]